MPAPECPYPLPASSRVLLNEERIRARILVLGRKISRHYKGERPLVLGLMNGALFFLADLLRSVDVDTELLCVAVTSYVGTRSTGKIRGLEALKHTRTTIKGRRILLVDDILDTGQTLAALAGELKKFGAAEVKTCVMLEKRRKQKASIQADWVGFRIADKFVVGYGLDYEGRYRHLKNVQVLPKTITAIF